MVLTEAEHAEAARAEAAHTEAARLEEQHRLDAEATAARALALANSTVALNAQAVTVQNLRAMVPIVLDTSSTNYSRWRELFLNTLGKYALADHVLSDDVLDNEE